MWPSKWSGLRGGRVDAVDTPKFCSKCGGAVVARRTGGDPLDRAVCTQCESVYYSNPKVIVAAIVTHQKHLLVCKRATAPAVDQWVLPSGYLECGETLQEGAARETAEETGVTVDSSSLELYSVVNMLRLEQITVAFRTEIPIRTVPVAGSECSTAEFVPLRELACEDFAWSRSMGDSVDTLLEEIESGQFHIHLVTLGAEDGSGFQAYRYRLA